MKEQLIRELVKNGKDAETLNKQYADKIKNLMKVHVNTVYREMVAPVLFSSLSPLSSEGEFLTGSILIFKCFWIETQPNWANFRRGKIVWMCERMIIITGQK